MKSPNARTGDFRIGTKDCQSSVALYCDNACIFAGAVS